MRLIQKLGELISRIAGQNQRGKHDEALATAGQAWGTLLDAPRELIDAVDTPTLAAMLREPAKLRAAAQLCHEEAKALAGNGDPLRARLRYRRALELMLEARAADPPGSRDDESAILELSREVDVSTLDPRYRAAAG